MYADSLSLSQTTALQGFLPVQETSAATGGFGAALAQAKAAQAPAATVDPDDEHAALVELFHLIALLKVGIVDTSVLAPEDPAKARTAGPSRRELEQLKEVLRRLIGGGSDAGAGLIDPATGKVKAGTVSLRALFDSLPPEVRNLLRQAFGNLGDLLKAADDGDALTRKQLSAFSAE